ncbi:hypothetical protein M430DRAFT_185478 [Amorphotheca resinae ATCC 22711]|uniref:Uncharacterized protein n=1 Tax=Amorphotheca resinae ATCC 22711 TaxID=857342 RepID=A0A2T3ASI3_AMORE|nr:hypothetical protein M430DRAFT_185478 [Amorphotheca resinae ATCC 22711]PSS09321.1 hypothetical protein M430DRAFT_185478 [Amorphotheca resinae ATCC 22711]
MPSQQINLLLLTTSSRRYRGFILGCLRDCHGEARQPLQIICLHESSLQPSVSLLWPLWILYLREYPRQPSVAL